MKLFLSYPEDLKKEIKRDHDKATRDKWPIIKMKEEAVKIANIEGLYQDPKGKTAQGTSATGTSTQDDKTVTALDQQTKKKYFAEGRCFICGQTGHIASQCSNAGKQKGGKQKRGKRPSGGIAARLSGTPKAAKKTVTQGHHLKKMEELKQAGKVLTKELAKKKKQLAKEKAAVAAAKEAAEGDTPVASLNDDGSELQEPTQSKLQRALKAFK